MTTLTAAMVRAVTKKYATVGELIEVLKTFDPDLPFGVIGHYGEFHEMDVRDVRQATTYISVPGDWEHKHAPRLDIVRFECPDVGEYPE